MSQQAITAITIRNFRLVFSLTTDHGLRGIANADRNRQNPLGFLRRRRCRLAPTFP